MPTVQDAIAAWERKDYATARAVCAELADADPHARYVLGSMISFGQGGPADPAEAARHYRLAADAGHNGARFCLGALYAQGRGLPQDFAEAMRWYRLAADAGHPDALCRVGNMSANGEGVPADLAEAGVWWERAAARGSAQAMQFLGRLHAHGDGGRAKDPGHAAHWFFKAWQQGLDAAEQDIIRVRAELEAAAEAGSAAAQNALGLILCFGHNDPAAAAGQFERAAAQDHPESLRMLGYLLAERKGVPQDEARAADLYRRAAELGDVFAQYNLAAMIGQGLGGLERDVSQAIKWFRRAADGGMHEANQPLAELLAERNRDRRDANEAVQRLMRVATAGPPDAEYRVAAGDGSWAVVMKEQGRIVAMPGLSMDELVGLPEEDE
jgi:TPR repeat protein